MSKDINNASYNQNYFTMKSIISVQDLPFFPVKSSKKQQKVYWILTAQAFPLWKSAIVPKIFRP